jgi:hypothetical protein
VSVQDLLSQQQALLHRQAFDGAQRVEHVGRQLDGHAASLNQQLAHLQGQLHAQQQLQADAQDRARQLAEQQAQAGHLLAQLQSAAAERSAVHEQALERQAAALTQLVAGQNQLCADQAQLVVAVAQQRSDVAALDVRADRQEALALLQQQTAQQTAQQAAQQAAAAGVQLGELLGEHTAALARLDQHLALQAANQAQLQHQLALQSQREMQVSRELQAVLGSTSWRITKPVRALIDALAGLFRRGGNR